MMDKIDEWINGGQGRQFYETNDQVKTVQIFKDIYGVGKSILHTQVKHYSYSQTRQNTGKYTGDLTTYTGRARANEFYHQGARTIDDLKSGRFELTEGQRVRHFHLPQPRPTHALTIPYTVDISDADHMVRSVSPFTMTSNNVSHEQSVKRFTT